MKALFVFIFMTTFASAAVGVKGTVNSPVGCEGNIMVWVSLDSDVYKERLLLLHTEVPIKGSFQVNLKPGKYQIRASDKKGCEFFERVKIKDEFKTMKIMLVKK